MANRARWAGNSDVLVAATARATPEMIRAGLPATGFAPDGRAVQFALDEDPGTPVLLLQPATVAFGVDPEGTRAKAPRRARATISTIEDELAAVTYARGGVGTRPASGSAGANLTGATVLMSGSSGCDPLTAVT